MSKFLYLALALGVSQARAQTSAHLDIGAVAGLSPASPSARTPLLVNGSVRMVGNRGEVFALLHHAPLGASGQLRSIDVGAQSAAVPFSASGNTLRAFGALGRFTRADNPAGTPQQTARFGVSAEGALGAVTLSYATSHYQRAADGASHSLEFLSQRRWRGTQLALRATGTLYADSSRGTRDTTYVVGGFPFNGQAAWSTPTSRTYADIVVEAQQMIGSLRLFGAIGSRSGAEQSLGSLWGTVTAEIPIISDLTLVGEAGRRSGLPELGIPSRGFGAIGMRVRALGTRASAPARHRGSANTLVSTQEDGSTELTVRGVSGRSIEVAGDFSDWLPIRLRLDNDRASTTWTTALHLAPGVHRIAMRVNGGPWIAPPGLPFVVGEFGQPVGVLVVR